MHIPEKITSALTETDVVSAVNFLIIQGKPTPMCCVGAVCVQRELASLSSKTSVDVHYTSAHVSIKQERTKTKYWRKDINAHEIDKAYDSVFEQALIKFGAPDNGKWFTSRKQIENFFLKKLKPVIGKQFALSLNLHKNGKNRNSKKTVEGKGSRKEYQNIQCHTTRIDKINKLTENMLLNENHETSSDTSSDTAVGQG